MSNNPKTPHHSILKPYPAYKPSGLPQNADWIGAIPEGWAVSKAKKELFFTVGKTPSSGKDDYYDGGDYNWANISDLKSKYISEAKTKITLQAIKKFGMKPCVEGSLLFSFKLSVGLVSIAKIPLYTNEAIASFRPGSNFSIEWAYYALPEYLIHNARPNIYGALLLNRNKIENAIIIFPPLSEQRAIAGWLDVECGKIDEAVKAQEELLALLDEKRSALISHTVTKGLNPAALLKPSGHPWIGPIPAHWEVKPLKKLVNQISLKSSSVDEIKIGLENIEGWTGRYIPTESEFEGNGINFIKGDILFGKLRPYLAKSWIASFNGEAIGDFIVIRCKEAKLFNKYLNFFILTKDFIQQVNGLCFGAKMPRIDWLGLSSQLAPLPPLSEQKAIAAYLDEECGKIDELKQAAQEAIALLKEKRSALISAAVTGKIDVRNLAPQPSLSTDSSTPSR
ncbi:restriction endonuclease subunit S [Formicincola oecophyllae]|uniref:Restriction endonuclease subunit S n=1 Tax=Formicincola oecophyllae TaxID=2558361 RepID=A0A4Y6U788_9PROT|nr:restriction endonuclease subunit S [Formicincola oecophyllae]QDH13034.1 restriction endonuclease subunit S [Formicincola oecophyllae]